MANTNKTLQLKRQAGFATAAAAKTALEAAFASNSFAEGEPLIAITKGGEIVLGIKSSTSGSTFYNAATVDGLLNAIENKIGDLASLDTDTKTSIVAAINSLKAEDIAYSSGSTDTIVVEATNVKEAIGALDEAVAAIQSGTAEYSISATTENLPANVAKRYNLTKTVAGSGQAVGENIDIPKDSSLANVYLGHVDDTLTNADAQGESPDMAITSGTGSEALCFINQLANSKYKLVKVDCEDFLQESEFKDGLQVNGNHEVSVKLDNTGDSAKFLYMKPGAGTDNGSIALSGITEAISAAVDGLDATESGSSTHVSVQVVEADGIITAVNVTENNIASNTDLETEIAARKAVDGQNGQTYAANTSANYISGATSLNDADVKLDTQVKANADAIAALKNAKVSVVKGAGSEAFLNITTNAEKTVYTVTVSGITAAITSAIEALDASQVGGTGMYLTAINESDGVISASAATLNAAAVAATPITAGDNTVAVTGTTVEAQIASLGETAKSIENAAYSGVTAGNGIEVIPQANGDQVAIKLTATGATGDLLSFNNTTHALEISGVYDCGSWS